MNATRLSQQQPTDWLQLVKSGCGTSHKDRQKATERWWRQFCYAQLQGSTDEFDSFGTSVSQSMHCQHARVKVKITELLLEAELGESTAAEPVDLH